MKNLIWLIISILLIGGEVIAADFTDNGDDTVTDNRTDLVWQKEDDGITRTWESAISYCEGLTLGGMSDWRLPNIRELESIINSGTSYPAIDTTFFPNTNSSYYYWSSTTLAYNANYALSVYFGLGRIGGYYKSDYYYYVRCVRGGQ